jgi:hypothetical protein
MFKKVLVILGLFALFALAPVLIGIAKGASGEVKSNYVKIQTFNPYGFDVEAEVKCNFDGIKKSYKFYKVVIIPKKSYYVINVPNNLTTCEIWPKVRWW